MCTQIHTHTHAISCMWISGASSPLPPCWSQWWAFRLSVLTASALLNEPSCHPNGNILWSGSITLNAQGTRDKSMVVSSMVTRGFVSLSLLDYFQSHHQMDLGSVVEQLPSTHKARSLIPTHYKEKSSQVKIITKIYFSKGNIYMSTLYGCSNPVHCSSS